MSATTAVLVVDVQRALVEGEQAVAQAAGLLRRIQSLLERARADGVPVLHLQDDGVEDRLIRRGTPGWELALAAEDGEPVIAKTGDDGFGGTALADLLEDRGTIRVVVVGIQSEMCVAATARGALARGLQVVLPRDGHTTYDVPDDAGGVAVPAAQVARVAEWSLGDTIEVPASGRRRDLVNRPQDDHAPLIAHGAVRPSRNRRVSTPHPPPGMLDHVTDPRDWFLTKADRANDQTRIDDQHPGDRAWSEGNQVVPLIHGSAYFRALHDAIAAARAGDLVLFTDWQGDADEQLLGEPGTEVVEVLCRADERGVDVRGLVWRSHLDLTGFFASENRHLGEQLQKRGAEALLDMRVRTGGSHHQKFVVVRYRDRPEDDVAFVGGMDLAHNRRDDAHHGGDPQPQTLSEEYGEHPPWHDVQVAIRGPAVHDVETVFRERWEDPTPLTRHPGRRLLDRLRRLDTSPDPLPEQWPAPPPAGRQPVQLLRTYPNLRHGRDYPFARGGERSVARGCSKAVGKAERIIYLEDQYFWGSAVGSRFAEALRASPELRVVVVIPLHPDVEGRSRTAELLGRARSLRRVLEVAPDRVAAYGIENHAGTPVYVHAKVCVIDDVWTTVGSDNFNRRSWTHDSELSAVVLDEDYGLDLRLTLAAEHLDRLDDVAAGDLREVMADCVDPRGMFDAYAASAARLQDWYDGGRTGDRPAGRLRPLPVPDAAEVDHRWAHWLLDNVHDPDGRPGPLRGTEEY